MVCECANISSVYLVEGAVRCGVVRVVGPEMGWWPCCELVEVRTLCFGDCVGAGKTRRHLLNFGAD